MLRILTVMVAILAATGTAQADARTSMTSIVESIEAIGFEWEPWGNDLCARDDLCAIMAGDIQIQAIGSSVDVMPSSQEPMDVYLLACTATLAGLTGRSTDSAMKSVGTGFADAARNGQYRVEFGAYTMIMRANSRGDLECSFRTP